MMENALERNGLRVNVHKTKGLQLLFGMESSVSKVDPCAVMNRLFVILFSVQNVRGRFIIVVLLCLG